MYENDLALNQTKPNQSIYQQFISIYLSYSARIYLSIYLPKKRCYYLINGALKMGGEQKESSWSKFVQVAI